MKLYVEICSYEHNCTGSEHLGNMRMSVYTLHHGSPLFPTKFHQAGKKQTWLDGYTPIQIQFLCLRYTCVSTYVVCVFFLSPLTLSTFFCHFPFSNATHAPSRRCIMLWLFRIFCSLWWRAEVINVSWQRNRKTMSEREERKKWSWNRNKIMRTIFSPFSPLFLNILKLCNYDHSLGRKSLKVSIHIFFLSTGLCKLSNLLRKPKKMAWRQIITMMEETQCHYYNLERYC